MYIPKIISIAHTKIKVKESGEPVPAKTNLILVLN